MVPIDAEEVAGKTVLIVVEAAVIVAEGIGRASGTDIEERVTVDNAESKD